MSTRTGTSQAAMMSRTAAAMSVKPFSPMSGTP
jgi:hypothetical protein